MSVTYVSAAFHARGITGSEKLVLLTLCGHTNASGAASVRAQDLAECACLSVETTRDALSALESKGIISIYRVGRQSDAVVGYGYRVRLDALTNAGVSTVDRS